jgi:hypothetical protein
MKNWREYLIEYHKTPAGLVPSHETLDSPNEKHSYGEVDGHKVYHTRKHTYVTDKDGNTVGHIGHKKQKGAPAGRLAVSNITKKEGASISMGKVLHHLIHKGHSLESDEMNTPSAHGMLMKLAKHPDITTHIEDRQRKVVPHHGDITSAENQKKYSAQYEEPHFWDVQKHKLVFNKK